MSRLTNQYRETTTGSDSVQRYLSRIANAAADAVDSDTTLVRASTSSVVAHGDLADTILPLHKVPQKVETDDQQHRENRVERALRYRRKSYKVEKDPKRHPVSGISCISRSC